MTNPTIARRTANRAALRTGIALAALIAGPALAQQTAAAEAPADEIIVTGIRGALDASAKIKKLSPTIVESVSALDIGKLPDVSIADSLARLPGVTAQRLEGRDQRLSIRGLGPDFSTTLLNGREQVTVGDNRGVEYDQYPSEFFKNVVVAKSADASLVAAGISGTVDLRMLRPLDQPNRVIALQARGQMNGQEALNPDSPRFGYRGSATFVDKFADDTFGIAIGLSATSAPSQNERYNAWGYANDANGNLILGGGKPYVQSNLLTRYGAVATLEWQPSDNFHSTFDALYSHFEEKQRLRGIEFPLGFSGAPQSNITTVDGFDTQATFGNVHAIQRNDYNKRDADNYSFGWNNKLAISDSLRLTVDASWSHADRTDFLLETYSGTGYAGSGPGDTITVTQQPNGIFQIVPTLDYTNTNIISITDPGGWGYNGTSPVVQSGFLNRPSFKDDLKSLRASLDGDFGGGLLKSWEVGANFSARKKTSAFTSFFLCPKGAGTGCTVSSGTPTSVPVPTAALLEKNIALDYLGVPGILTLDPLYLYNNTFNAAFDNRPVSLVRDNRVKENVFTAYALTRIDGDVGGVPVTGSIGAQFVHTNQSSDGSVSSFIVTNGVPAVTIIPATQSVNYNNFLPSLALAFQVMPDAFIKFGASRTMVRPRLDQERVNQELTFNAGNVGIPGGNPVNSPFGFNSGNTLLRPYKSNNIDLSFEKYFAKGGYVAITGYYKRLSDYVDSGSSTLFDFTPYLGLVPPETAAVITATGGQIGLNRLPTNDGEGNLKGVEMTLSLPFANFSEGLKGFGVFGSASYTDSKITLGSNPGNPITLPGLSDWVVNAEAYYEQHGFQVRVSYRYRAAFLGEVAGLSANPTFRQAKAEGILDAQIAYDFQPGSALEGLSIMLQAKNLTDRPFITYQNGDERQVIDYQRYGRDFYIGIGYKF